MQAYRMASMASPAAASAFAVVVAAIAVLLSYDLGAFSAHMGIHIASMNIAAPLLAAWAICCWHVRGVQASWLWIATALQMVLLWVGHAPAVHNVAAQIPALASLLHVALFLAALLFWFALLTVSAAERWQAIPALLITGKLACLLAALLIFAPRTLYKSAGHAVHVAARGPELDDQHLAGLLMIMACPLSYLVAAVIITVQLIGRLQKSPGVLPHHSQPADR